MAFENLSDRLKNVFGRLGSRGVLTEKEIKEAMREVRLAFLEADVNFLVVKDFINTVTEKCLGETVLKSLTPAQQVIKIVNEQLTALLGGENARLTYASRPPSVYMLIGLQGAGKTTTAAKLARMFVKQNKKPLLLACDVYRPAATEQLKTVSAQAGASVFETELKNPVDIAAQGVSFAREAYFDPVIIDTAGRLTINDALMNELLNIKNAAQPQEILLVIDAMTGQDAVTTAKTFNERVGLSGVILTKLDGDARGGAALSVRHVTGRPIKFVGQGEKIPDLEPFYPDRMAGRILGMGDVLSLIEKAQTAFDEKEAIELTNKMRGQNFNLEDFLTQLRQVKKMGPLKDVLSMIPGINLKDAAEQVEDDAFSNIEAIILSMTPYERKNPHVLNGSRKKRVAAGSGTTVADVNRLLKQFDEMKKMMKGFLSGGGRGLKNKFKLPF